nr:tetratricopeptide repeat protein [Bacteroidota bacterium]
MSELNAQARYKDYLFWCKFVGVGHIFQLLLVILVFVFSISPLYAKRPVDITDVSIDSVLYRQALDLEPLIRSNPNLALEKYLDILEQSRQTHQKRVEAIANTNIAVILRHQGLYTQSLEHYFSAIDYLHHTKDSLNTGWFYVDVGNIYFQQQLYGQARNNYLKSLELYEKTGVIYAQATALNNLGLIAKEEGDSDLALKLFQKALRLREKGDDRFLIVHSYQYIGDLFFELGKIREAMEYYNKILDIGVVQGDFNKVGATHQSLGDIQLRMGNISKAMDHFQQAEQNFIIETRPEFLTKFYLRMAEIYQEGDNSDSLLSYLNKAHQIAIHHNLIELQQETLIKLIDYCMVNEKYLDAINYYQLLNAIMQEFYHDEFNTSLQGIETQLTLSEYKKNMMEKNARLEKTILIRNAALAFGAVFLLFLIYMLINFRGRRKTASLLHHQKEAIFQQELRMEQLNRHEAQIQLESKQRALITQATMLQHKNDQLIAMQQELEYQVSLVSDPKDRSLFKTVLSLMNGALNDKDYWKEFEAHFVEVFPGFLAKLSRQFPVLTSSDLKICAYQKMNLNTKDIALLTGLSVRSVESRRYRLRQKLNLSPELNLVSFLHSLD